MLFQTFKQSISHVDETFLLRDDVVQKGASILKHAIGNNILGDSMDIFMDDRIIVESRSK